MKFYIALIAVATLLILIGISKYFTNKVKTINSRVDLIESTLEIREKQLFRSIFYDGVEINMNQKILSSNNDSLSLSDLKIKNSLIFKFGYRDCGDCVEAQLEILDKYLMDLKNNLEVIVLYEFLTFSEFQIRSKIVKSKFGIDIFGCKDFTIPENCYFLMATDGRAYSFFVPDVNDKSLSSKYIEVINSKH